MNILYISCEDVPGDHAGAVHTWEVARNLVELGHRVTLLSLRLPGQPSRETKEGVEILRLPQRLCGVKVPLLAFPALPELLRRHFDAVMERYITAGGLGGIYATLTDTPLVLEVNSPHVEEIIYRWKVKWPMAGILRLWVDWQFRLARASVAILPTAVPSFARDKVVVNYWGANDEQFNRNLRESDAAEQFREQYPLSGRFLVLFVGSFRPWQGVSDLPEIIRQTKELIPEVLFLLAGGGEGVGELLRKLHQQDLGHWVLYLGNLPHRLMPPLMALADVGLAPFNIASYPPLQKFGFFWAPSKLMEYLASSLPVVASDYPTLRNILDKGKRGILVAPGDIAGFARAILKLKEHPQLAKSLGANARRYIERKGSWRKHCQRLELVLEKAVSGYGVKEDTR
jgi:glycosyltransferase involved in cell wall biosynthesis